MRDKDTFVGWHTGTRSIAREESLVFQIVEVEESKPITIAENLPMLLQNHSAPKLFISLNLSGTKTRSSACLTCLDTKPFSPDAK